MGKISQTVADSASPLLELGKNSERIAAILDVIDDIVEQINLLALNAAFESIAEAAKEVEKSSGTIKDAAQELASLANELRGAVDWFKLD